jgi:hypothetical protein
LPFELPYQQLDALIQKSFGGQAIRMNKNYLFRANSFKTKAYGDRLGITVSFTATSTKGEELRGELFLVGLPVYDAATQILAFENLDFVLKSSSAKATLGAMLKQGKINKQLGQRMKMPLGELVSESLKGVQERLTFQSAVATVTIQRVQVVPVGFFPTATGLAIPLTATGSTAIQWK